MDGHGSLWFVNTDGWEIFMRRQVCWLRYGAERIFVHECPTGVAQVLAMIERARKDDARWQPQKK